MSILSVVILSINFVASFVEIDDIDTARSNLRVHEWWVDYSTKIDNLLQNMLRKIDVNQEMRASFLQKSYARVNEVLKQRGPKKWESYNQDQQLIYDILIYLKIKIQLEWARLIESTTTLEENL